VPLEGWFIPAPGSSKLIIANHPLGFSRSGIPTHNVLAYDLRNHGLSSAANGGVTTHGFTESRDVVGSLEYAAMTRFPEAFEGVRCLVSPQPVTPRYIVQRRLALLGLGDRLDDFDTLIR
jgi:hypothetical protein